MIQYLKVLIALVFSLFMLSGCSFLDLMTKKDLETKIDLIKDRYQEVSKSVNNKEIIENIITMHSSRHNLPSTIQSFPYEDAQNKLQEIKNTLSDTKKKLRS